ncbi:MAG: N-6 DNA methylase, partial [Planctomycetota bacterium]|nr:N-6 DNA methylase [Planctomycetota bacterium]
MSLTISQLKAKWNKEKSAYTTQEVGSGTQSFVKDILLCEELFNLKDGKLTTSNERRKNEVIYEYKTEQGRRIDFAIFINPEVIIPVEIERYQNIDIGTKQLLQYQIDLDRKYGILTDGADWRLYINNIYIEFTLDNILDKKSEFWTFWEDYIKSERYYLSFFEAVGQLPIFKEAKLLVEQNRELFFEDITCLIRKFNDKLKLEGYFNGLETKEKKKKAVEITYAYIIQFILYKTLVDNEFSDFRNKFESACQNVHRYLKGSRYKDILSVIKSISNEISQNIYRPFAKEQEIINQKLQKLYDTVENKLNDVAPWLDIFVFIKKYSFANIRNEIFGYIYENYLKDLYEDQKKGQYFTDPAVVNFMLDQIGYTPTKLKNTLYFDKNVSFIDPFAGSGTFLYSSVDRLIKATGYGSEKASKNLEKLIAESVFGLDIAEFPLYLAEMNILMRMLPMIIHEEYNNPVEQKIKVFLTKDSIAEFMDTDLRNTINDMDIAYAKNNGQRELFTERLRPQYASYVRDENDLNEMKNSVENRPTCPRRRFDYVVSNPPYVGYNECSKQKVLVFEWMKQGRVKLNDIYGVNLHSVPDNRKKYSPKPNLYAFSIALGLSLLKDNGKLCYIIPQTILTAGDLDVLRYHLAKFTTIEKIITFSGKMFIGRGLKQNKPVPTSSLIFVVSRKKAEPLSMHEVEIIHYKDPDDEIEKCLQNILVGKKTATKKILQNKLLQNIANWNFIKQDKTFLDFYEQYKRITDDISIYYTHTGAEHKFKSRFYFDGGGNINERLVSNNPENSREIFDYKNNDYCRLKISKSNKYYPKNGVVTFPQGSQGIITFDQKYKVIWRTRDLINFQFCDRDILLVSNQSLTISSNSKSEILYLLFLLNSKIIRLILDKNLRQENEQAFLVPITAMKEFVRIPKITEHNQHIKDEVIKRTEEMLSLEEKTLSDFVDFSDIMFQKFNSVTVDGGNMILAKNGDKIDSHGSLQVKCRIKSNAKLVN